MLTVKKIKRKTLSYIQRIRKRPNKTNNKQKNGIEVEKIKDHTKNSDYILSISEQDKYIESISNDGVSNVIKDYSVTAKGCPFLLEQLETGDKLEINLSEVSDTGKPRHPIGCTPHECHGSMMDKKGFEAVSNNYSQSIQIKLQEAKEFLAQFATETDSLPTDKEYMERLNKIEHDLTIYGTYEHTHEELEFGCRLAWRNSGRCIMRKISFSLELRDCRSIKTSEECFEQIVQYLEYANNKGSIKPVISVFPPKKDGVSAPIRVWNRQLLGYATYKRQDGSVMGDPINLDFTALCANLGWEPPSKKSDWDILPLVISDDITGHSKPKVFELPLSVILEVPIHHPEHELFSMLNLRWYAIPAISNMGVDIGGVYYQTCPFNGWYSVTEIGRNFLDKQRYDLAEAVATACDIPRTKLGLWRDDVQLQIHKAILYSFSKESVSMVDHHTASESFLSFYNEEISKRNKCPADWVWLVPPAAGSMTGVFHQEMLNFIVKPQYRSNFDIVKDQQIAQPTNHIILDDEYGTKASTHHIDKDAVIYDKIIVCFGSESGTSHRFATHLTTNLQGVATGPFPLDDLPHLLLQSCSNTQEHKLILIITSTYGRGEAPIDAKMFLERVHKIPPGSLSTTQFCVFALGNSAYARSFVAFGKNVHNALDDAGAVPVLKIKIGDELMDQAQSFREWSGDIFKKNTGVIYGIPKNIKSNNSIIPNEKLLKDKIKLRFKGFAQVISVDTRNELSNILEDKTNMPWYSYNSILGRSTDLFSFEIAPEYSHNLIDLNPGDHIALYPMNVNESVEFTYRMLKLSAAIESEPKRFKRFLKGDVDLVKPITTHALVDLWEITDDVQVKYIIDALLTKCSRDRSNFSVLDLISKLPPGSIPSDWIVYSAPPMDPRLYSLSEISVEDRTISICQSIYTFSNGHSGTTSIWLRSLNINDEAFGIFSKTDLHLPKDGKAPVLLIANGSGIAPFRSFWISNPNNQMYLFYGCRNKKELPFASEIESLKRSKHIYPYIAYSREISNKLYVQDMLFKESNTVLGLLYNKQAHIYIVGLPVMAHAVKNKLVMILCTGNDQYPALQISQAIKKLIIMKYQKRLITEVYGTISSEDDAMHFSWKEATSAVVRTLTALGELNLPRSRHLEEFMPTKVQMVNCDSQFRPEYSHSKNSGNATECTLSNETDITTSNRKSISTERNITSNTQDENEANAKRRPPSFQPIKPSLSFRLSWRTKFGPEYKSPKSNAGILKDTRGFPIGLKK